MKFTQSGKIEYLTEKNKKTDIGNENIKTTNINILLNRVKKENKSNFKKKIILSISVIGILFFICILTFGI